MDFYELFNWGLLIVTFAKGARYAVLAMLTLGWLG